LQHRYQRQWQSWDLSGFLVAVSTTPVTQEPTGINNADIACTDIGIDTSEVHSDTKPI
jgi:hypothetical protein